MFVSSLDLANWWSAIFFEITVLGLAWKRNLFSQLPFLFGYLVLLVVNEALMFGMYRIAGYSSQAYLYSYWLLQVICISLRAVVVYELCQNILSPFAGVWRIVSRFLFLIAGILVAAVLIAARGKAYHITRAVLTEERGLELIVVSLLIAGLIFCRYYGVRIQRHLLWIALGLGLHSLVQVANNTYLQLWSAPWARHFAVWEGLRHFSFSAALLLWLVALWKPLPAVQSAPVLWTHDEYERFSPQVTKELRNLNTRLLEMWK